MIKDFQSNFAIRMDFSRHLPPIYESEELYLWKILAQMKPIYTISDWAFFYISFLPEEIIFLRDRRSIPIYVFCGKWDCEIPQ